ncbi:hypothetical protein J6590_038033 [Homalodisca vitripennis]|nr:hypothetical protein J6590_038033 [Homalodisca vitripennis]
MFPRCLPSGIRHLCVCCLLAAAIHKQDKHADKQTSGLVGAVHSTRTTPFTAPFSCQVITGPNIYWGCVLKGAARQSWPGITQCRGSLSILGFDSRPMPATATRVQHPQ